MKCEENGKPGFKWGGSGKCYTYSANDTKSKEEAKKKALLQAAAILSKQNG